MSIERAPLLRTDSLIGTTGSFDVFEQLRLFHTADPAALDAESAQRSRLAIDGISSFLESPDPQLFCRAGNELISILHYRHLPRHLFPGQFFTTVDYAYAQSVRHLDKLVQYTLESEEGTQFSERVNISLNLISAIADAKELPEEQEAGLSALKILTPTLVQRILQGDYGASSALDIYVKQVPADFEQIVAWLQEYRIGMPSAKFSPNFYFFFARPSTDNYEKSLRLAKLQLEWAFPPDEALAILDSWERDLIARPFTKFLRFGENLWSLAQLEAEKQGLGRWLYNNFGIKHFGRYPEEILLDQYEFREDKENPFGFFYYPYIDWETSFHVDRVMLQIFYDSLKNINALNQKSFRVRVRECGGPLDQALADTSQLYGRHNFALFAAHSTPVSMTFARGVYFRKSSLAHLSHLGDYFTPDATVIFNGCSTGTAKGIAQRFSKVAEVTTIGPDNDTHLLRINPSLDRDTLHFRVTYKEAQARYYKHGRRIKPSHQL